MMIVYNSFLVICLTLTLQFDHVVFGFVFKTTVVKVDLNIFHRKSVLKSTENVVDSINEIGSERLQDIESTDDWNIDTRAPDYEVDRRRNFAIISHPVRIYRHI